MDMDLLQTFEREQLELIIYAAAFVAVTLAGVIFRMFLKGRKLQTAHIALIEDMAKSQGLLAGEQKTREMLLQIIHDKS